MSNLPEHTVGQDVLPEHILKKTGEINSSSSEIESLTQLSPSLPEIITKASKFKRYNVPPEVQITHEVQVPNYKSRFDESERTGDSPSRTFQTMKISKSKKMFLSEKLS